MTIKTSDTLINTDSHVHVEHVHIFPILGIEEGREQRGMVTITSRQGQWRIYTVCTGILCGPANTSNTSVYIM